jgi:hypothetical protein
VNLGKWDLLKQENDPLVKALFSIQHKEPIQSHVTQLQCQVFERLSKTGTDSYSAAFSAMTQLHAIYDLKRVASFTEKQQFHQWFATGLKERIGFVEQSAGCLHAIFSTQRMLLKAMSQWKEFSKQELQQFESNVWLLEAKCTRKMGFLQSSYSSLLRTMNMSLPTVQYEESKLLWMQGCHFNAMLKLDAALNEDIDPSFKSKLILKKARWMEETNRGNSNQILTLYQQSTQANSSSQKAFYHYGRYFSKLLENYKEEDKQKNQKELF